MQSGTSTLPAGRRCILAPGGSGTNIYTAANVDNGTNQTGSLAQGLNDIARSGINIGDGHGGIAIPAGFSGGIATYVFSDGRVMVEPNAINHDQYQLSNYTWEDSYAQQQPIFSIGYEAGNAFDSHGNPVAFGTIAIGFRDPGLGYKSYAWIQTVTKTPENKNTPFVDMTTASINGKNYPFYYSPSELLSLTTSNFTAIFSDQAAKSLGNLAWSAEVTLVAVDGKNIIPIATFTWGFSSDGVLTFPRPVYQNLVPSMFKQNVINQYNFNAH